MESYAHRIIYSTLFQKHVSFASYWHDTLHEERYLRKCRFLPYLNNEINHKDADLFKKNICQLNSMVLVMSHNEKIIEPRESCHFCFYKQGSKTELMPLEQTDIYKNDTLGLKILHESSRLHVRFANCTHDQFQEDEDNFVKNTLEFLRETIA